MKIEHQHAHFTASIQFICLMIRQTTASTGTLRYTEVAEQSIPQ
jgi:uncharacterized membrane protein